MLKPTFVPLMLAFGLMVTGCAPSGNTAEETKQTGNRTLDTLVISATREPDTLDVQKTTFVDDSNSHMYDTLLRRDLEGNIVPGLAESYEVSEDGKVWTFKLRKDVTFHTGEPMTAESIKVAFERYKENSPVANNLGPIEKSEAVDQHTFKVYFSEPFAPFANNLCWAYLGPVDPKVVAEKGDKFGETPSGAGILKFNEHKRGSSIIYDINKDYKWGPEYLANQGAPDFNKVEFKFIKDDDTRILEFQKGTIQVMLDVPPNYMKPLEVEKGVTIERVNEQALTFLGFNNKKEIFSDKRVRQAIAMAVDRDPIVNVALEGVAKPVNGPLPPSISGYSEKIENLAKEKYTRNIDGAKKLLEEAGWTDANGDGVVEKDGKPFSVELWLTKEPVNTRIAQILQSQLKEIGIDLKITVQEDATIRANTPKALHDMILWKFAWSDADVLYAMFANGQSIRVHFERDNLHDLLVKARQTTNEEERRALYEQAQEFLVEEEPMVPLFVRERIIAHRDIEGFKFNPYSQSIIFSDIKAKQ